MSQLDLFGGPPVPSKKEKLKTPPTVVALKPAPAPVAVKKPVAEALPERRLPDPEMAAPFSHKSKTSEAAAQSIQTSARTLREKILEAFIEAGAEGLADHEIVQKTGIQLPTVNPRRGELVKLGHICDSGRVRKTKSGRDAVVWVVRRLMKEKV
jgi:hypothetical protein